MLLSKTEIGDSKISGKGTFAKKKIERGEFITRLTGKACRIEQMPLICIAKGISEDNPLQIADDLYLILDYTSQVINHSCEPNAGLQKISDLYATRDIYPGDEITYDYSVTVGINDPWLMACCCGVKHCRQQIGNITTVPRIVLNRYVESNILQDFIKAQLNTISKFSDLTL